MKTASTKDELCAALGVSLSTLRRVEIRNRDNPPPEMNESGVYVVEEWREWLDECEEAQGAADAELMELRKEIEREKIRGLRFKNDLAEGKYEKKEFFLEFAKKLITRVRGYIDDYDEKAAILFSGDTEKLSQLRVLAADTEAAIEADFAMEAAREVDANGED